MFGNCTLVGLKPIWGQSGETSNVIELL